MTIKKYSLKTARVEVYKKVFTAWGLNAQLNMLAGELAEAITAIMDLKRSNRPECDKESVLNELADVRILIEQLETIWKVDLDNLHIPRKMEKLVKYLDDDGK